MEVFPDVTLLMPKISDIARTEVRYYGLIQELNQRGMSVVMAESHNSFKADEGIFDTSFEPRLNNETQRVEFVLQGTSKPSLVRDLTMPKEDQPIYQSSAVTIVHHPEFNAFVRDKSNVAELFSDIQPHTIKASTKAELQDALHAIPGKRAVIKPVVGMGSQNVVVGDKKDLCDSYEDEARFAAEPVLIQEFIETKCGIAELGFEGRHNYRLIMIGGVAVFGFARMAREGSLLVEDDSFSNVIFQDPDVFPDDVLDIVKRIRTGICTLPDGINTVVAGDIMRGTDASGQERMFLCELNRRPLRNSPYHGKDAGTLWASREWDIHEANLLAKKVA